MQQQGGDATQRRVQELEAELEALRRELQAAREKQQAGDQTFRRFSESGIIGIGLFQPSGEVIYANEALLRMIGRTAEELTAGQVQWHELVAPEWRPRALEAFQELKTHGGCAPYEAEYLRRDGTRVWGLFTGVPTGDERVAAFVLDITERKKAEELLRFLAEASRILASSLDYQTTLDRVARLVVPILADWCDIQVLDETGGIRRVAVTHSDPNKIALAYEMDRRYPVDPDSPRGVPQVLRTGQPEIYPQIPDELLVAGASDAEHLRIIRELGLKSALVMPLSARGRTLGAITLVYAESDRRYTAEEVALAEDLARRAGTAVDNARLFSEAQAAVRLHQTVEQKLILLTEATSALIGSLNLDRVLAAILALARRLVAADAYAVWRHDWTTERWTVAASEGLSAQYRSAVTEVLQHSREMPDAPLVIGDIDREPVLAGHHALLEREGIRSMLVSPLRMHSVVGGTLVFYYRQAHTFDDIELKVSGALANLAASAIATTELYQAATRRAEQLAEADRLKDQFLAMLAHELRNPLGAISNAIQVIQRTQPASPAFDRAREVVQRQNTHMASLVDQLLDVSRISHGKIELHPRRLDLARLVRDTCEDHRRVLEAAELSLDVDAPEGPLWVDGDPTRLRQALGNLLQNAAKFTPPGGHVTVRAAADEERERTQVMVADTGIGIPAELLPHLFDAFVQADRSLDRTQGGLGLGLALVKGIIGLHGGRVHAQSEGVGRGAQFIFELPSMPASADTEEFSDPRVVDAGRLRVLIIEDNADAAETLRDLLELSGHQVQVAFSGLSGVEVARRFSPDVVLCDLGLPGMDGYAVAAELRRQPETASARLIAITGYGQEEDLRRTAEAGFDAHLIKPVDVESLRHILE
jgi:PAS domain S-box-containing protein